MTKPTLADVAREAGVGTATVERVLNARGFVSPPLVERVLAAARKLDYGRRFPERHRGTIRIEVLMVQPGSPFFGRLNDAFARIAGSLDRSILVQRTFLDQNDPRGIARHVAAPGFRRAGLIVCAPDHPEIGASLGRARDAGTAVLRIVSKSAGEDGVPFIGIDNRAAGRTAAFCLSRMLHGRPGRLLALCHGGAYHGHRERILGFSDYLAEHSDPSHVFPLVVFGGDDEARSTDVLEVALDAERQVIGLYNAGGANPAVARVLARRGLAGRVMWVGHELTDDTRTYLKSGIMDVVLDQSPETQARRAVDAVLNGIGFTGVEANADPVPFLVITPENVGL